MKRIKVALEYEWLSPHQDPNVLTGIVSCVRNHEERIVFIWNINRAWRLLRCFVGPMYLEEIRKQEPNVAFVCLTSFGKESPSFDVVKTLPDGRSWSFESYYTLEACLLYIERIEKNGWHLLDRGETSMFRDVAASRAREAIDAWSLVAKKHFGFPRDIRVLIAKDLWINKCAWIP